MLLTTIKIEIHVSKVDESRKDELMEVLENMSDAFYGSLTMWESKLKAVGAGVSSYEVTM